MITLSKQLSEVDQGSGTIQQSSKQMKPPIKTGGTSRGFFVDPLTPTHLNRHLQRI